MATTKEIEQGSRRKILPLCAIHEEEGRVILVLEMPGVGKDDVSIRVENDELQVHGRRAVHERNSTYLVRERKLADFYSSYTLDQTIDREQIEAETAHGVLTITLQLKQASRPRQITVREVK